MRKNLYIFGLLANLVLAAAAHAAPELTVEHGSFNFGSIAQGKKVQHNFIIKNSGDATLQIKQLTASCGCTAAKPSSSTVAPGRTAEIQVTFDSANFAGTVQKTVTMLTNAGRNPFYVFKLEGKVLEALQVTPRQLNLGALAPGVAKQVTLSVTNSGDVAVKLLGVNVTSTSLQIKPTIKKGELKAGETGTIDLVVTPRPEARVLSAYLHILTNHPQKKEITVPVYGSAAK